MIISSLCEYHKYLRAKEDCESEESVFAPYGYSIEPGVRFQVSLSAEGKICGITSLAVKKKTEDGKKEITLFPDFIMPKRSGKPGVEAQIVEARGDYLFGLKSENGELVPLKATLESNDKNKAFKKVTITFFENIDSPLAQAYFNFAKNWNVEEETQNEFLLPLGKDINTKKFVFSLYGRPDLLLQDDEKVKAKWDRLFAEKKDAEDISLGECSIYGEKLPIATKTHDKIRLGMGSPFVCVNIEAAESYGKKQGANSSISVKAMEEYSQTLNQLISDPDHHKNIEDLTIIYFALTSEEEVYNSYVNNVIFDPTSEEKSVADPVVEADRNLGQSAELISQGEKTKFDMADANVECCFFGVVFESSRFSVRFSYRNTFGQLKKNVDKYHEDFAIGDMTGAPAFEKINKELISPKKAKKDKNESGNEKKKKTPPDMTKELLASMLQGTPFPQKILQTVVRRIKTDLSEDIKSSIRFVDNEQVKIRVGLVKACLNRKIKNEKEKITMALNKQNSSVAYQCGRLFAVLEVIQRKAYKEELNKTIVDSYFSSAASTPALVFPKLVMLSQNHLDKLSDGAKIYYSKLCGEIIDNIVDEFPKTLALEDQGKFIVGYYQQKTDLYSKKEKEEE